LIGREQELACARAFVARLPEGPRALLIEGEAGIGKTALLCATVADATTQGCRVLTCVAAQADAHGSFAGLADLAADIAEELGPALSKPHGEALEVALGRRRSRPGSAPDTMAVGIAFGALLGSAARTAPVVVAVDDAELLDRATQRALSFAAWSLDGRPVGVLATQAASTDPLGLERTLGEDRFARMQLGSLSREAVRALLADRFQRTHPMPTLLRIEDVSRGNPLFALELARALAAEPGAPLPVAGSLHELAAARVASVSADGRRALLAAAALARPSVEAVERASTAAGLAAAVDAGLVRVTAGRVALAHPLYASAVHAAATGSHVRGLHRRLAELESDPEQHARHLALATEGPDEPVAAALERAAAHARARGACESAAELLELAHALTPPDGPDAAWQRGLRAAAHHVDARDRPRARALLERILSDAPRGSVRVDALRLLAEVRYDEDSFADTAALLGEALEQADDPGLAVAIELNLAYVRAQHLGDLDGADAHAVRALVSAEQLGDRALLGEALAMRSMVDHLLGRGVDWTSVERSLALEDSHAMLPLPRRPRVIAALLALHVGRLAEARERLTALRAAALASGDDGELAVVLFWLAWLETASGAFDAAAAHAAEGVTHAALTGREASRAWALSQRALVHAHRGDAAAARADAAAATAIAEAVGDLFPLPWVTRALALLELSLGHVTAAWAAVREQTERLEAEGILEPLWVFLPDAAEVLIARGELGRAESLLRSFERPAQAPDRAWVLVVAARCRAMLLAARGDLWGARDALDRALVEQGQARMPFELARTLLVRGQLARRLGEPRVARLSYEEALGLFEQLGAPLWAERARRELDPFGARREPVR
jgi:tetratricopeptide (TPR) repeat protein